ncbi:hypothetical protein F4604DRAFT_1916337 [Suillus subluteus]|nr:hypothetical protein F4604DRAFT_1916337 [Suillus subluteus]
MENTPLKSPMISFMKCCAKKLKYKSPPQNRMTDPSHSKDMKEPSSIKSTNVAARPSPLGARHPSNRVSCSGPQFFPSNILENEGDSEMAAETTQPPTSSPTPPSLPPSLTPPLSNPEHHQRTLLSNPEKNTRGVKNPWICRFYPCPQDR